MRIFFIALLVLPMVVIARRCFVGNHFLNGWVLDSVQCDDYPCYRIKTPFSGTWEMGCDNGTKRYCANFFEDWCEYYENDLDVRCCYTSSLKNYQDL